MPQTPERSSARRTMRSIRAEHEQALRDELVKAAAEILDAEGSEALTIKRVAEDFGISIGTFYRLIRSKSDLLARVRSTRLLALAAAAASHADATRVHLAAIEAPRDVRTLAQAWSAGEFWIDASSSSPLVVGEARKLMGDPELDRATRDGPIGSLLEPLSGALDESIEAGLLTPGHNRSRAALVVSIVSLPACTPHLWGGPDPEPGLGARLLAALLEQWGADRRLLAEASELSLGG